MDEVDDLKLIRKRYGEKMMHLCRKLFPSLLETKGLLYSTLSSCFYPSRYIYDDLVHFSKETNFQEYINVYSNYKNGKLVETELSAEELLKQAGYKLYKCNDQNDILKFKKYYKEDEELCTFKEKRLDTHHVFFAVKENANLLDRNNYTNPQRQDEYGVSVISIQFTKRKPNFLSIKNRYNHSVANADATFSNNLEMIIPGLTKAFEKEYNLDISQKDNSILILPRYAKSNENVFYKYYCFKNGIYYCIDNIIIDNGKVIDKYKKEKERYIFIETFILDLKEKKFIKYDNANNDSFIDDLTDIEKINIELNKNTKNKIIQIKKKDYNDLIIIEIDKYGNVLKYKNNHIKEIKDEFLSNNSVLNEIEISNVGKIGNNFLPINQKLEKIDLPKVEEIGNDFLKLNILSLKRINAPALTKIGNGFMEQTYGIESVFMPNLKEIGLNVFSKKKDIKIKRNKNNYVTINEIKSQYIEELKTIKELLLENTKGSYYGK